MNALARTIVVTTLLSTPAVALADDDSLVVDPSMRPPPPPPPPPHQNPMQPPPPAEPKRTWLGADLGVVIPLGDYADGADFAAGALFRLDYIASPQVDLSIRAGYLWHKTDQPSGSTGGGDYSLAMLPLLVGGEFKVGGGAFVYGEAGLNVVQVSISFMGLSASESETYLSVGAGIGFRADRIKGKVGFWMPGRPENGPEGMRETTTLYGVLGTIGYDLVGL
jgi:hypothetical protein